MWRATSGDVAPTAECAIAWSIVVPFMIPVKAPAASRIAAIVSAARACASIRSRCAAASG